LTTEITTREQREQRLDSVPTLTQITDSDDSQAFYNAGEELGAWTLKPYSRPIKNQDGFEHIEYLKTDTGEDWLDEQGEKKILNSLNEIMVYNRETDSYEAIPYVSTKKWHKVTDHNRLLQIVDKWVGRGAVPELVYLSPNKAQFSGILRLPDLFTQFSGLDQLMGKLVFQNSIDGSKRFGIKFSAVRYVCTNMIHFGGKNSDVSFSTKHTQRIDYRIAERIEIQHEKMREVASNMENQFVQLANVNMDENKTVDFLREFLVSENKNILSSATYADLSDDSTKHYALRTKEQIDKNIKSIVQIASGNGMQGNTSGSIAGTAYGVYQAILEQSDWYRDVNRFDSLGRANSRFQTVQNSRTLQAIGVDDAKVNYKVAALREITDYANRLQPMLVSV